MLKIENLTKQFIIRDGFGRQKKITALRGVNLSMASGEILGLAGESGSGKTTLAKIILALLPPTSGTVYFKGRDITKFASGELFDFRRWVQIVWQNPDSALDPRMTVEQAIAEPLFIHRQGDRIRRAKRVVELLEIVKLNTDLKDDHPHRLSSGQRQRVAIARALALSPELLICDEPVSLIDAALRLEIVELLLELRDQFKLSYLFISHDLALLRLLSDRMAIISAGEIVETAATEIFFNQPRHPCSRQLLAEFIGLSKDPVFRA